MPGGGDVGGIGWEEAGSCLLTAGHVLGRKDILFSKVSDTAIQRQIEKLESANASQGPPYAEASPQSAMTILQSWTSEWGSY